MQEDGIEPSAEGAGGARRLEHRRTPLVGLGGRQVAHLVQLRLRADAVPHQRRLEDAV